MTHVFKHPKFYRIPRDKSDSVISNSEARTAADTCTGSGPQASSSKPQAPSFKRQASEALSDKPQAPSYKRQA